MMSVLAALSVHGGCASPIGYGSGIDAQQRDALHKSTPRPEIDLQAAHVSSIVESDIPVPPAALNRIMLNLKLEEVLTGAKRVPRIVRTEPLSASWGELGTRRRVVLEDGNTALEELIEVQPDSFRYVVWNFTSSAGRFVRYAVGQFHATARQDGDGSHLRWEYRFRPKTGATPFIAPFVRNDYHSFMERGMEAIRRRVIEIHTAQVQGAASPAG